MTDDSDQWREVAAALARPEIYGLADPVEVIDTSVSMVFLTGGHAYKIRKPLKLSFLDFSSRELRHADCLRELALNRRTAPEIYLDVVSITRGADGALRLGGAGEAIEWAVRMRRFSSSALLDHMALQGKLTPDLITRLARNIAAFHTSLPPEYDAGGAAHFRRSLLRNDSEYRNFTGALFSPAQIDALRDASLAALDGQAALMDARQKSGWVRHCHGDLHLGNIFCQDGEPVLFDCIEFSDTIAKIDVLYDLAFLLMDLWRRDLPALANLCLNQYLAHLPPADSEAAIEGLALLPLFLSSRAGVRAFVLARTTQSQPGNAKLRDEAQKFLTLAQIFLRPSPPKLLAVSGFSGSGKSVLAKALAPGIGAAPGALILRSDEIRKQLAGAPLLAALPAAAYTPESSAQVYASIIKRARAALRAGHSVIADAVHAQPAERAAIEAVAQQAGVAFQGLWLEAPPQILAARAGARRGDASDADAAIVARQLHYDTGAIGWARIDASGAPDATLARATECLARNPGFSA